VFEVPLWQMDASTENRSECGSYAFDR
jgi:hypothetical protein